MLARLESDAAVAGAWLSSDGARLLLEARPGASERLLPACEAALAAAEQRPVPQPGDDAERAWRQRAGPDWLRRDELWRLSWREAETFTDRLLGALESDAGVAAGALRPVLVESFYAGLHPQDGTGPAPHYFARGAPVERRRAAVLEVARAELDAEQVAAIEALLSDREWVHAATRPAR